MQVGPYILRPYQDRAVDALRLAITSAKLRNVPARLLLQSVCGSGKTIISSAIMKLALDKGKSCGFLASGRILISQKSRKLKECGIRHGIMMAGQEMQMAGYRNLRESYGDSTHCIVASKDTYWARAFERDREDKLPVDLLIVDEAHLGLGPSWMTILEAHKNIVVIGLTATAALGNGKGMGAFYNELVTVATHQELLREGMIVPCQMFAPQMPDLSDLKVGSESGDYVLEKVQQRFDNKELIGNVVRDWKRWGEDRPTACFASGVQHSIHLRDEFVAAGIPAAHIDAETPDDEREQYYAQVQDGTIKILTNYGVLVQGFDLPCLSCGILAFATGSVVKYLQVCGRMFRPFPGKPNCIAEGELVLTNRGLIPIEQVCGNDRLWDGCNWVAHGGTICKGIQDVISYAGITATPDHIVWTNEGWRTLIACARLRLHIAKTGIDRSPVWLSENLFANGKGATWSNDQQRDSQESLCEYRVSEMQTDQLGTVRQFEARAYRWLPTLQSAQTVSDLALDKVVRSPRAMPQSESFRLEELWWERNQIQVCVGDGRVYLDQRQFGNSEESEDRPNRQRRTLRTWESALVYEQTKLFPHDPTTNCPDSQSIQTSLSARSLRRQNTSSITWNDESSGSSREMVAAIVQTKRRVWDILDAGPLHRFTVSGLLVHNCIFIDHGGNVHKHGWPQEDREWKLDTNETVQMRDAKLREHGGKPNNPITCPKCHTVRDYGPACPGCGHRHERTGLKVRMVDGTLKEIKEKKVKKVPMGLQKTWMQCLGICGNSNRTISQARGIFRAKTGEWPGDELYPKPQEHQMKMRVADVFPGFCAKNRKAKAKA